MARPAKPDDPTTWANAPAEMPQPIVGLTGDALDEWQRIGQYLIALHRVAKLDKQALTSYCLAWANFARIYREEFSEPWGKLSADGPNCEIVHPAIPPLLRYAESAIRMSGQFGMTARTRDLCGDHGNRKSTALKQLMGNQRKIAQDKLDRSVVKLSEYTKWTSAEIAAPDWMTSSAMAEYYEVGNALEKLDLFTPLDRVPLIIGSCLFDLLVRANEQMTELYTTYTKKVKVDGEWDTEEYQREHPLHKTQIDILSVLHKVWKDYGQTSRYRKIFSDEKPVEKQRPMIFKGKFG